MHFWNRSSSVASASTWSSLNVAPCSIAVSSFHCVFSFAAHVRSGHAQNSTDPDDARTRSRTGPCVHPGRPNDGLSVVQGHSDVP